MNLPETARLLSKAALIDSRTFDQHTVAAWQEVLADVDYRLALDALTLHRRESTEWVTPAHIIAGVRKVKAARSAQARRAAAIESAQRPALEGRRGDPMPANLRALLRGFADGSRIPD